MNLADYLPVGIMLILVVVFALASFGLNRLIAPRRPTAEKLAPYECGIVPEVEPSQRFPVKFYLIAMLFVIFDIETIFLFAWAVRYRELGWFGIGAVGIFTLLVIETLGYVWKRGALDWNIPRRARHRPEVAEREVA